MALRILNCEETSKLISEAMDHPISFFERINLKMHLLMCKFCSIYMRQMHLLKQLVKKCASSSNGCSSDQSLPKESKTKIKLRLRQSKP